MLHRSQRFLVGEIRHLEEGFIKTASAVHSIHKEIDLRFNLSLILKLNRSSGDRRGVNAREILCVALRLVHWRSVRHVGDHRDSQRKNC